MSKTFEKDEEIEYVIKLIEENPDILNSMNTDQLEMVNDYLKKYKNHLENKGEK